MPKPRSRGLSGRLLPLVCCLLPACFSLVNNRASTCGDGGLNIEICFKAREARAGNTPNIVLAAELDGDNKIDIAVVNGASNDVTLLINRGGENFENAGSFFISDDF